MYSLDTNTIIDFFRGEVNIIKKIAELKNKNINLFISPLVLCELYKGAYLAKMNKDKILTSIDFLLETVDILDFNKESCLFFGQEYGRLSKIAKTPKELDLMIASISKVHNKILITKDKKDFENFNVKMEFW